MMLRHVKNGAMLSMNGAGAVLTGFVLLQLLPVVEQRRTSSSLRECALRKCFFFFLFFSSGPCHLPKTHCEEQCQEEEDVRVFHRVCALTQVTGGEFSGSGLSRLSAAETVYVPLQSGFGSIRSQPSHPTT